MKRYYFNEKNGDATLLFDAENEDAAITRARELLQTLDGWLMEEGEDNDDHTPCMLCDGAGCDDCKNKDNEEVTP